MAWPRSSLVALGCAAALAAAPAVAHAAPDARLDRTVRILQQSQNRDGGFGGQPGLASDPDFSAWVALGLAAAGINPQDQTQPGGASVYDYLTRHADALTSTTDDERVVLVALAAGAPPRQFGGLDPVAALLARQLPDGSFAHVAGDAEGGVNDTAFAILALAPLGEPATDTAVGRAAGWLLAVQQAGGGWGGSSPTAPADGDVTGAVLEALAAAGRRDPVAVPRALAFLHGLQNADGGFGEQRPGEVSNAASTAWIVQGLWAVGVSPQSWTAAGGASPLDFLASLQQPSGLICWRADDCTSNPIWMTAYAAPAFAGRPLPLAAVPRAARPVTPAPQAPSGEGVAAGGGGSGAPLFSRPQPGSRGHAAGGVRSERATTTRRFRPAASPDVVDAGRPAAAPVSSPSSSAGSTRAGSPAPAARAPRSGGGAAGEVSGRVIGRTTAADATAVAAAGLRSARPADGAAWVAPALAAALALALLLGAAAELHRPRLAR